VRIIHLVLLFALVAADPATRLTGGVRTHEVRRGDTLVTLGARAGVEPRTLANDNGLDSRARLTIGDRIILDNRHIAPDGVSDGLVLNVPQRILFLFVDGEARFAFPVAVGRSDWRTPRGEFAVEAKETDPVWDVPISIQQEMARSGKRVVTTVPPGPANPLGARWIGLTARGVGIHGTNQPSSIYRFATHGCVRLHPDDIAAVFDQVEIGTPVHIIYEPVLLAVEGKDVFIEVHPDVYGIVGSLAKRAAQLLGERGLEPLASSEAVGRAVTDRTGRAALVQQLMAW
jgi:L,D-transpeptidase ErfK/SrfK